MANAPAGPSIAERASALIEQYFDVFEGTTLALARLEVGANRALVTALRTDYQQSIEALSELLREHGEKAPTRPNARRLVADGKVALGEIAGDRGVLGALKSNEKSLLSALEREARRPNLSSGLAERVEKERAGVLRHLELLDERLEDLRDGAHVLS